MFTSEEQVTTFVDMTEKFVKAVMLNTASSHPDDAALLNKMRDVYEKFLMIISGLSAASNTTDTLLCPECNYEMALRTNRTNGNKFWGCKKYPNCKGTRDENGLSRQDREEKKQREDTTAQEGGFSFNRDKRSPSTEVSPPVDTGWINPFAK